MRWFGHCFVAEAILPRPNIAFQPAELGIRAPCVYNCSPILHLHQLLDDSLDPFLLSKQWTEGGGGFDEREDDFFENQKQAMCTIERQATNFTSTLNIIRRTDETDLSDERFVFSVSVCLSSA